MHVKSRQLLITLMTMSGREMKREHVGVRMNIKYPKGMHTDNKHTFASKSLLLRNKATRKLLKRN